MWIWNSSQLIQQNSAPTLKLQKPIGRMPFKGYFPNLQKALLQEKSLKFIPNMSRIINIWGSNAWDKNQEILLII